MTNRGPKKGQYKHSQAAIEKIRIAKMGDKSPNKGQWIGENAYAKLVNLRKERN